MVFRFKRGSNLQIDYIFNKKENAMVKCIPFSLTAVWIGFKLVFVEYYSFSEPLF